MTDKVAILPGIYEDVPFERYCRWNAVNVSSLKQMNICPARFKASWDGLLHHESKPLRFGRLVHAGQLEPLTLIQRYAVMPDYHLMPENVTGKGDPSKSKSTKFYKQRAAEFTKVHEEKEVVTAEDFQDMSRAVAAVATNPKAYELLNQKGRVELSICWEDPQTGILCKARIDKELADSGGIADLKTAGQPESFNWSLWDYRYHQQAAFYRTGWATVNNAKPEPFWLVVVGPADNVTCTCLAAPISDDLISIGETENMLALSKVRLGLEAGEWPNIEEPDEWTGPKHKVEAYLNPEVQLEWS